MTEFEEVYKTYFNDVFLYVRRLSGSEAVAEEITSETFFKAMRAIDKFRDECDIRVWLCQIAKNSWFTYLKKQKRAAEDIEDVLTAAETDVEEKLVSQDEAMRVYSILHDMAEPYKEVFMLRVFGELSFAKIGQIFGKTENWACVAYHRTRNKIKERLEAEEYGK